MGHGIDLRTVIIEDRSHIILWEDKSMGGLTLRDECSYLFVPASYIGFISESYETM